MNYRQATRVWAILSLLVAVCVWTLTCQTSDKQSDSRSGKPAESANSDEAKKVMNPNNSPTPQADGDKANDQTGCLPKGMKPSIQITDIPRKGAGPDETERIAGTVTGVSDQECKVVIFAHTNTWYVQPYIDSSDTPIGKDCKWDNDTHLGSEYAALLVKKSYKPPSATGILPEVGGSVLAVTRATAKN